MFQSPRSGQICLNALCFCQLFYGWLQGFNPLDRVKFVQIEGKRKLNKFAQKSFNPLDRVKFVQIDFTISTLSEIVDSVSIP